MNHNAEELFNKHKHIARQTLFRMYNNPYVIAKRHKIQLDDLLQYAYTGLWLACKNYNPDKAKFMTHAINNVKWHIQTRLRTDCNIRYYKATDYKKSSVVNIQSMDNYLTDDKDMCLHDITPDETCFEDDVFESMCNKHLKNNLTEQQKEIIKLRKLGYSTGEIGKMLGVSGQNIRYHLRNIRKKFDEFFMEVV